MFRCSFKSVASAGLALICLNACTNASTAPTENILLYYGAELPNKAILADYDVIAIQPYHDPSHVRSEDSQTILAYISIGQAYPGQLKTEQERSIVIGQDAFWKSDAIDVRRPEWHDIILNDHAKAAMEKGFDGFMLDTADGPIYYEQTEPEKYQGMIAATVKLIASMNQQNPYASIMLNRGFEIWPEVAPHIDSILLESTISHYDLEKDEGKIAPDTVYQQQLAKITSIRQAFPHLKMYSVDYWDMNDAKGVTYIYDRQRKQGVIPYVATPTLDRVYPEPEHSVATQSATVGDQDA